MKNKTEPFPQICRQCGYEFIARSRMHRYCSQSCVTDHNIATRKEISGRGLYPGSEARDKSKSRKNNERDLARYRAAQSGSLNPKVGIYE